MGDCAGRALAYGLRDLLVSFLDHLTYPHAPQRRQWFSADCLEDAVADRLALAPSMTPLAALGDPQSDRVLSHGVTSGLVVVNVK